jgi:hypothetical protein
MVIYSGVEFSADFLGIPENNFRIALDQILSGDGQSIVYPDNWAFKAATGSGVNFTSVDFNNFFESGRLNFDGDSILAFKNGDNFNYDFSLEASTIFLSFERKRIENEILLSSIDGVNPFYSGFCLGVNHANRLYFRYWNGKENGCSTFVYPEILADKNLIYLSRSNDLINLGRYDINEFDFKFYSFNIPNNNFIESNEIYLGGYHTQKNPSFLDKNRADWAFNGAKNFSGVIDAFYFIFSFPIFYSDEIARGIFSSPSGQAGYMETFCFETGYFIDSGFFTTGITGYSDEPYSEYRTGITGYRNIYSGWSTYGFTGYYDLVVGMYYDNCARPHDIIESISGFGLITGFEIIKRPLTGVTVTTGFNRVDLTGSIFNSTGVWFTTNICDDRFIETGTEILYNIDYDYLKSLSFKEISIIDRSFGSGFYGSGIVLLPPQEDKELYYNTYYNSVEGTNIFYPEENLPSVSGIIAFGEKGVLIDSGGKEYSLNNNIFIDPNFDYTLTGATIYIKTGDTLSKYSDKIITDFYGEDSFLFLVDTGTKTYFDSGFVNKKYLIFNNSGELLSSGIDYIISGNGYFSYFKDVPSGKNLFLRKDINFDFNKIPFFVTNTNNTIDLSGFGFNSQGSQLYLDKIRKKINIDYYENAKHDLLSGSFFYETGLNSIYGSGVFANLFLEYSS